MKFASMSTDLNLNHRWLEQQHVKSGVFKLIQAELSGSIITVDMLGSSTKDWLWRRGFKTDASIQQLASVTLKGLGAALHILLCILSDQVREKNAQRKPGRLYSDQVNQPRDGAR